MEGLRALPWFQEKSRRGELAIDDCKRCKMNTDQLQRMSMGCGYEPATVGRGHLTVWQPPTGEAGYRGEELTTCAGYTCNLPEVGETALARVHWGKGNASVLGLTEDGLNAIVVLEGQYNQLQAWLMTDEKDGGGRRGG